MRRHRQLTRAKEALEAQLASLSQQHAQDVATLTNRIEMLAADDYRSTVASEQVTALQQQHERELEALRAAFAEQVESQGRAVAQALADVRDVTESSSLQTHRDDAEAEIQALRRKCRALESLLDKKFEELSVRSSSASVLSQSGVSTSPFAAHGDGVRVATKFEVPVLTTDCSDDMARLYERKRLAHRLKALPMHQAPNADDTFATDTNTTMRNATWLNDDADDADDSVSGDSDDVVDLDSILSSAEVCDRSAVQSFTRRARPLSASSVRSATPSNADILALVRKLEDYTAQTTSFGSSSSSSSAASSARSVQEPESEHHTLFRTPETRASTRKSAPPPVHRRKKQQPQLRTDAPGATGRRLPHKPSTSLTSKPLRTSLVSSSSVSSASPVASTPMHQRGRTAAAALANALPHAPFR